MLFYCRLTYTFIPRGKCLDLIPGTFLASKGYKSVLGTQLLLFLSFFSFHQSRIPEDREKFVIIGIISHLILLKIFCCIKFTNIIISGIYKKQNSQIQFNLILKNITKISITIKVVIEDNDNKRLILNIIHYIQNIEI